MTVRPDGIAHGRCRDLPDLLEPGDLVVVNTSATLPARVAARRADGDRRPAARVDVAGRRQLGGRGAPSGQRRPGPRRRAGHGARAARRRPAHAARRLPRPGAGVPAVAGRRRSRGRDDDLPAGARPADPLRLPARHLPAGRVPERVRDRARQRRDGQRRAAADRAADRARSWPRGIPVVPVVLHTGVSSPELHEPPYPERFAVPEVTARLVTSTRRAGAASSPSARPSPGRWRRRPTTTASSRPRAGWTDLVLGPERPARTVTGLLTGLHAPEASHLQLLEAVAGPDLVARRVPGGRRRALPLARVRRRDALPAVSGVPRRGKRSRGTPLTSARAGPDARRADGAGTRCTSPGRAPRPAGSRTPAG